MNAATDVVEVGIVLADDLSAYDILGALKPTTSMGDTRVDGIKQSMEEFGSEGTRAIGEIDADKVSIGSGREM